MSSMLQRLAAQDATQMIRIGAALGFMLTDTPGFSYNLALMLFGLVSVELSATGPEQFFIMTMLFSGIFDLLGLMRSKLPPQIVIAMILMVLKAPIYFSTLAHLRERGGELAWASRGFTGGWPGMGGMGGGGNTLGSESAPPAPTAPGGFPSGGFRLGGDDGPRPPQTRDGYSAIA